jgi:predicted transcriptional regulator
MMKDRLENVENDGNTGDSGSQSDLDLDEVRRKVGGRTTRQIMSKLRNQDYAYSVARDLRITVQTFNYHLKEKLLPNGLVEETGEEDDKTYYQLTEKGEIVLEGLNEPE